VRYADEALERLSAIEAASIDPGDSGQHARGLAEVRSRFGADGGRRCFPHELRDTFKKLSAAARSVRSIGSASKRDATSATPAAADDDESSDDSDSDDDDDEEEEQEKEEDEEQQPKIARKKSKRDGSGGRSDDENEEVNEFISNPRLFCYIIYTQAHPLSLCFYCQLASDCKLLTMSFVFFVLCFVVSPLRSSPTRMPSTRDPGW
jgi:hypothetical protein